MTSLVPEIVAVNRLLRSITKLKYSRAQEPTLGGWESPSRDFWIPLVDKSRVLGEQPSCMDADKNQTNTSVSDKERKTTH